jgi:hypothetical protein
MSQSGDLYVLSKNAGVLQRLSMIPRRIGKAWNSTDRARALWLKVERMRRLQGQKAFTSALGDGARTGRGWLMNSITGGPDQVVAKYLRKVRKLDKRMRAAAGIVDKAVANRDKLHATATAGLGGLAAGIGVGRSVEPIFNDNESHE